MSKILKIHGLQIFDSRGIPTVSCKIILEDGTSAISMAPSGASTGSKEALELRDKIEQSAMMLGFPEGTNMSEVFDTMDETLIQVIKTSGLDN